MTNQSPLVKHKRLPVGEQTIVYYEDGVRKGLWQQGEYVSLFRTGEVCLYKNCDHDDEHVTFDGQIFFKRVTTINNTKEEER